MRKWNVRHLFLSVLPSNESTQTFHSKKAHKHFLVCVCVCARNGRLPLLVILLAGAQRINTIQTENSHSESCADSIEFPKCPFYI